MPNTTVNKHGLHVPQLEEIQQWPIHKLSLQRDEFMEEVKKLAIQKIINSDESTVRDILETTLFSERLRIYEKPWRVDPKDEKSYWKNIKQQLLELNPDDGKATEQEISILSNIVERYVQEITGEFRPKMYLFARKVLNVVFNRLLNAASGRHIRKIWNPELQIEDRVHISGPLKKIRALSEKCTLVLLPTHFSNLDSILIGYALDQIGLPAFMYGAGLNLFNNRVLSHFMSNLGAYKLDRRKKNPIYLSVLKSFSAVALSRGGHGLFFPGGTRSRSGAIEGNLKLGLLGTAFEAQRMNIEKDGVNAKKIVIVPLVMSYHFVLEAATLIKEHLKRTGKEKYYIEDDEFHSYYRLAKWLWQFFSESSEIYLSFGDPVDLFGNSVDENGNSFDMHKREVSVVDYFSFNGVISLNPQREAEYTRQLGNIIIDRFHRENIVFSSHAAAFTLFNLLRKKFKELDLFDLLRIPKEDREVPYELYKQVVERLRTHLYDLQEKGGVKLAEHFNLEIDVFIEHGVKNIGIYHTEEAITVHKGIVSSEDMNLLYFYHNRLTGYALEELFKN